MVTQVPNKIEKPDYLAAVSPWVGSKKVWIAGKEVEIQRPTLGRFIKTLALLSYPGENQIFEVISEATGIREEELDSFPAWGLAILWAETQKSLGMLFTFPFMQGESKGPSDPWDYSGRWIARLIHEIANCYHWSKSDIYSLYPEEAFGYMQEILIDQHRDHEWEYTLSQAGIDRNGRKAPFPPLPWARPVPERVEVSMSTVGGALGVGRTKKTPPMALAGEFIDLEKLYKEQQNQS